MYNKQAIFSAFQVFIKTEDEAIKQVEEAAKKVLEARAKLVESLKKAGVTTLEEARPFMVEFAAMAKRCALVEGRGKGAGRLVFDSEHANYENARKYAQRLGKAFDLKKKNAKPSERKEVDPVTEFVEKFEALTRAQQHKVKRLIGMI